MTAGAHGLEDHAPAIVRRAAGHPERVAIADGQGAHRYAELLAASEGVARALLASLAASDLRETPVALLAPAGFDHVAGLWGIWRAGGIAVPLSERHPPPELAHVLDDSGAPAVIVHRGLRERLEAVARGRSVRLLDVARREVEGSADLPPVPPEAGALILYTSGTTGRPKGALHTHASLEAQVRGLVEAWEWRAGDRILHVLPLHHTHGIVNALLCALWSRAACEMLPGFDARRVWRRFGARAEGLVRDAGPAAPDGRAARGAAPAAPDTDPAAAGSGSLTLFMAVPTVYVKLIRAWEEASPAERRAWSEGARALRLMVSGSAALPVPVFDRWREITGHALLERYGMTEIGMALSNPLRGERRPGTVGRPLPGVEARLVGEEGRPVEGEGSPGEIEVRGPTLFREYWNRPDATREAFRDGWFRTGDEAVVEDGYWRILGRKSVDIIKTGGYKVSALEIEALLRAHPAVADCAVVGVADPEWGERVCVAVVPAAGAGGAGPSPEALEAWSKERLAPYKRPRRWRLVAELPRNAMGKVTKSRVKALFESGTQRAAVVPGRPRSDDQAAEEGGSPSS